MGRGPGSAAPVATGYLAAASLAAPVSRNTGTFLPIFAPLSSLAGALLLCGLWVCSLGGFEPSILVLEIGLRNPGRALDVRW